MPRLALLLALLPACSGGADGDASKQDAPPQATPTAAATPVDPDDPEACGACHHQVVAEWKESMHARAHQDRDPVYAVMRELRMAKQGDQIAAKCAQCHNPRDPAAPDSAVGKTAIACATCHNLEEVHAGTSKIEGAMGAKALVFADGNRMVGPHDLGDDASPVHGTGAAPAFITDGQTLCLACHDAMKNPAGVATCTTGPEYALKAGPAAEGQRCTDCHMPRVEGPAGAVGGRKDHASHAFLGPHRAWYQDDASFLASGVELKATLESGALKVSLANLTGHAFPSAFPGRMAILVAVGHDAAGEEVWRNWSEDAMKESPASVLNKVYVDAEGQPILPPFAVELKRDSRLTPGETRELEFDVPQSVESVELKLLYRLVPPPAHAPLKLEGKPEAEPRVVTSLKVERS